MLDCDFVLAFPKDGRTMKVGEKDNFSDRLTMTRDICRILLIEDEPTTVKLIQRLLLKAPQCSLAG